MASDVYAFLKSKSSTIRVDVSLYNDSKYVNVREWKVFGDPPEMRPTKSGFTVPLDKWQEFVKFVNSVKFDDTFSKLEENISYYVPFTEGERPLPKEHFLIALRQLIDRKSFFTNKDDIRADDKKIIYKVKRVGDEIKRKKVYVAVKSGKVFKWVKFER